MRVLWFTNQPLPQMIRACGLDGTGIGGHWMGALFQHLTLRSDIELGVATVFPGLRDGWHQDGVAEYFTIAQHDRLRTFRLSRSELDRCVQAVTKFRPQLIHFHGSERAYGLLKAENRVDMPAVVSLQGILAAYADHRNFFGALSTWEIVRSTRLIELPLRLGILRQYLAIREASRVEELTVAACQGILGRTSWDRCWARILNQNAQYHEVGELLRPAFRDMQWSLEAAKRHTIFYTNAGHPRRGTEDLLEAVRILKQEFPEVRLRLAGTVSARGGYGRFLRRRVERLGVAERVTFLGYLNESQITSELTRSHVFAITSYIENSPNSLAEAMHAGLPCVASCAGGIPSMLESGRTGLLYPVGDAVLLAESIRTLFRNDDMAVALGRAARDVAIARHDPDRVVGQLLTAYRSVHRAGVVCCTFRSTPESDAIGRRRILRYDNACSLARGIVRARRSV